jgi:Gas vesicle synthesis protein GvpL/GvpF
MASGCYVYAILAREPPLPPGLRGFGGAAVSTVPWRALAAATSPLERGAPRPTPENVWRHEAVVEVLRSQGPALPVRFGTVLADASAVAHALAERYDVLVADLARLGDKVELGLNVLWDPPITPGEEQLPSSGAAMEAHGPGLRYLQARLAAHRREVAVRERARSLARELDRELGIHALERRCTLLPTPRLVVRAAYLLDPRRVPAFQDAFAELRQTHPDLRLLISGPWPPYSFVTPPEGGERPALSGRLHEASPHQPTDNRPHVGTSSTCEHIVKKGEQLS